MDPTGNVTKTEPYDHVTPEALEEALDYFRGGYQQVPPIFSAIKKDGKRMYEEARKGRIGVKIDPRHVHIAQLNLLDHSHLPKFDIEVECGGGTYIRALIRDIGVRVGSVATTTYLERTRQARYALDDCLAKDDWNLENICKAIERSN